MADQVTIWNMALQECGTRSSVASITENSTEANVLAQRWDNALASTLQKARWNFARRQVALTLLADATQGQAVPSPWVYEYAYPSDCAQGRNIMPTVLQQPAGTTPGVPSTPTAVGPPIPFVVGIDLDANRNQIKVILTNQPQAIFVYTGLITSTQLYDDQFVEALSVYLASRVCFHLTGDKGLAKDLSAKADALCVAAAASNGNEGLTVIDSVPDWIRVRGYAADYAYPDGGEYTYGAPALTQIQ